MTARPLPMQYTRRWREALELAERAHRGAKRKAGDKPYLLHPFAVSQVMAVACEGDDDLVIAAYLHDAVEDTGMTLTEVEDRFGSRVARLVAGVTKPERDAEGRRLSSEEKSALTEQEMARAHSDVVALKAADLVTNLTDLIIDQEDHGYGHWEQIFGARAEDKIGHYLRLGSILVERLEREEAYPVLSSTLAKRLEQIERLYVIWTRT